MSDRDEFEAGEDVTDQFIVSRNPGIIISVQFSGDEASLLLDAPGRTGLLTQYVHDLVMRAVRPTGVTAE